MNSIEGIIVDIVANCQFEGKILYDSTILSIDQCPVDSKNYIIPGFIDSHVHIESSMLTPLEYSKAAVKHGVIGAVADPHEIANVCGVEGLKYMQENAMLTPMKISFGVPSCVPATKFETNGETINAEKIDFLFKSNSFSHLGEMMNFPGVINSDSKIEAILDIAKKHNKPIDGHAPSLTGALLKKYVNAGISTDHECTTIDEAIEKLILGMKILLRKSSASNDFQSLMFLLNQYSDNLMLCADDCHPEDLKIGYINLMVKDAINNGIPFMNVLKAASINPIRHYKLNCGLLQTGDTADFVVIDKPETMNVLQTVIDGVTVWDGSIVTINHESHQVVNNFFKNIISTSKLKVKKKGKHVNVIEIVPNSLITKRFIWQPKIDDGFINSSVSEDILKIVVVNRYKKSTPFVGFVKGSGIEQGAIAGSIAHDSHNIISIGVDDNSIMQAIDAIQNAEGGLVVVNDCNVSILPLPVAGLMSCNSCESTASKYLELVAETKNLGCTLSSPFMTMAFLALLVIPELKIGDKGLFDVNQFRFIDLQS